MQVPCICKGPVPTQEAINSRYEIAPEGTETKDWKLSRTVKQYDLIDCYDRNKWYPSTICDVYETYLENVNKMITYKVGFKLYPKFFKNKKKDNMKIINVFG